MYPFILEGILKEKIWGGQHLKDYGKSIEGLKIGESWEIACREDAVSRVKNGKFKGLTLKDLLYEEEHNIFLNDYDQFPLMIKYIDANDNLSLQVHPDDQYAHAHKEAYGKTEAWYIISAEEGSEIILGTTETSEESLKQHIESEEEINFVKHIEVHAGELYFVPSGTLHAIGKGIILLEIQQNSDTTYRLYDYNRNRPLHIQEAKEVTKLDTRAGKCTGTTISGFGYELTEFLRIPEFVIERIKVTKEYEEASINHDFHILNCIDGYGMIAYEDSYTVFEKGTSLLIPAKLGKYKIIGRNTIIRTYVPS